MTCKGSKKGRYESWWSIGPKRLVSPMERYVDPGTSSTVGLGIVILIYTSTSYIIIVHTKVWIGPIEVSVTVGPPRPRHSAMILAPLL